MLNSPTCRCGHALAVHNPCSICKCPSFNPSKRAKKYAARGTPNAYTEAEARLVARMIVDAEKADR